MANSADITIWKPSGEARLTAHIGKGSKWEAMLMEKDCVTLKFTLGEARLLRAGDYIELPGAGRYELTGPYTPEQSKTTGGYDYEVELEAQYRKLGNKLLKFLPFVGTGETSWSYTDNIEGYAKILLDNIRALAYSRSADGSETLIEGREGYLWNGTNDWRIEWDDTVDATKAMTLTFSDTSILDAVDMVAEALECEWWWEQETLRFGKCQWGADSPTELTTGEEICGISKKQSQEDYATRLYCYGSEKNLPSTYRKELVFTADTVDTAGDEVRDSARELDATYWPKEMRTVGSGDKQTIDLRKTHSASLSNPGSSSADIEIATDSESLSGGLESGWWTVGLSAFKPTVTLRDRSGNASQAKMKITLTAEYASGATESWSWEQTQYIYATDNEIKIEGLEDAEIELTENATKLTARVTYSATLGAGASVTASINAMNTGQLTVENQYPVYGATGVTVEVIDTLTGATEETIEGAEWNPEHVRSGAVIKLPSGKTMAQGQKYRLPELKEALVPAAYFTSKYAVLERYTDLTTNGIVNSRLLLPEEDEEGNALPGYIDVTEMESEEEAVEKVVAFPDIYPRRTSTVTEVLTETLTDKTEEADGSTTLTDWTSYRIKDDLFNEDNPFDDSYLIDGQDLEITFQSGLLNGLTFGVAYLSDHTFEIQRDETTLLPNELIKPQVGDTYILSGFNIAMLSDASADYIVAAERELLEEARKYAEELNTDTNTYECTIACDWARKNAQESGQCLGLGQRVNLYHEAYFEDGCRESRVIGWEIPIDIAWDNPVYYIGETASYSRLRAIEEEVKSASAKGGVVSSSSGSSNGGSGPYVIKRQDTTTPTDANVYSALRTLLEIAERAIPSTVDDAAQGLITFMQGLISEGMLRAKAGLVSDGTSQLLGATKIGGEAVTTDYDYAEEGGQGAGLTQVGSRWKLVVDQLFVRQIATFMKLEIRELAYIAGNIILSCAASEIEEVEEIYDALGQLSGWKCKWTADDGSTATTNTWKAGDQAICQTFNIAEGVYENVGNRYYWRLVSEVGDGYVVISAEDKDGATDNANPNCCPQKGDKIVQLGYRQGYNATEEDPGDELNQERTNAMILATSGTDAPSIKGYGGITEYKLEQMVYRLSPKGIDLRANNISYIAGDVTYPARIYMGDWSEGSHADYYTEWTWMACHWLCINPEGTDDEPTTASTDWHLVSGDPPTFRMEVYGDEWLRAGQTETYEFKVFLGWQDITNQVSQWKIERDTGDEAEDTAWGNLAKVKNFAGSIELTNDTDPTKSDLGRNSASTDVTTFTVTAAGTYGTIVQPITI